MSDSPSESAGCGWHLGRGVEFFLAEGEAGSTRDLVDVVEPHAGYIYSDGVAGRAFASVAAPGKPFERVLLIGPAHYFPLTGIAAPSAEAFATQDAAAIDALKLADLVHKQRRA